MKNISADSARGSADPLAEPPPPFFRSWRRWYAFLIVELIVLIALFRLLTVAFS